MREIFIIPKKIIGLFCVIVLIILVSLIGFNYIAKSEEEKCWETLRESASTVNNELKIQINNNTNVLKLIANDMAEEDSVDNPQVIIEHMKVMQYMTMYDRIDVLYPDNSLLLQSGETIDATDFFAFDDIVSKGQHMSSRVYDVIDKDKHVINYFVPVKDGNDTKAVLIGVINCEKLLQMYGDNAYNGRAYLCIVDSDDGNFIMDSWHKKLGNLKDIKINKLKKGYKNIVLFDEVSKLKSGAIAFSSEVNGKDSYMYYTPIGIENWELLIIVQEDVAFESLLKTKDIFIASGILEIIILLIFFIRTIIINIRVEKKKEEFERQLNLSNTLVKCITCLSKKESIDSATNEILHIISDYFGSDRAYIFEINYEKEKVNNTYEYAKEGVTKEIDNLQNVPLSAIELWIEEFKKLGQFSINSLDKDVDKNSNTYEILANQNIDALIAMPLIENEVIIGFLGIDNPTKNYENASLISSVTYFLMDSIKKRKTQDLLERLSFEDALTKMFNRNKFNVVIDEYENMQMESLGFGYFDMNGLKATNDKYGHKAGDALIKKVAECLTETFGEQAYRIGGDEFVVIVPNIEEDIFLYNVVYAVEILKKEDVSISVGTSWRKEDNNIIEQMIDADKKMYKNKKQYYEDVRK